MHNSFIAHVRKPTDAELGQIRELWRRLKHNRPAPTTRIGVELNFYLTHSIRLVGMIAGLRPSTGEPALPGRPLQVSEDGVARLHDLLRLCSAIVSLWTPAE